MEKSKLFNIFSIIIVYSFVTSCSNYNYVDDSKFIGKWELKGREIYSGMEIERNNNSLTGKIIKIPTNRYGKLFLKKMICGFLKLNAPLIIILKITEFKIAHEIFSIYDLPSSNNYYAFFSDDCNKIYFSKENPNINTKRTAIFLEKKE
jgi:hypothetical protein